MAEKTQEELEAEKKKAEQDAQAKDADEKIAALQKDPEALKKLVHERSQFLGESQKYLAELNKFEKAKKDAEETTLREQGKFKELADKERQEKETLKANFRSGMITSALKFEAERAGIIDLDALALIDRSAVTVSDDLNEISGAKEAIETLKVKKSYLFAKPQGEGEPAPGSPKPSYMRGGGGTADGLTPEQRIDKWYKENPTKLKS